MDLKNIIGKMRSNAHFEQNAPTDSDSGGDFDNYSELLTTRCYLYKKSGARVLNADTIEYVSNERMVVRFQAALQQAFANNVSMRVTCNNKLFTIESCTIQEESKARFYILELTETQAG